ncbi:anti-sigma-F factor Fin [Alicyclobacillus kakegawensis]|uniref:anti-sigma-F factor Fin n=1 Tax=Alicyclobacillus kakegawensis TaxID=392012 RepID=UPI000829CB4F|nr:anti-sigma-F factor Fin [Alicyclobacillus kakegawensis]
MRVEYVCRHCHHRVGELENPLWDVSDVEQVCGFSSLNAVERREHIAYNEDCSVVYVQVVCEDCQRALEAHPELLVEGKLLQ